MTKVKLYRNQVDLLDELRMKLSDESILACHGKFTHYYEELNSIGLYKLAQALIVGYEIDEPDFNFDELDTYRIRFKIKDDKTTFTAVRTVDEVVVAWEGVNGVHVTKYNKDDFNSLVNSENWKVEEY